MSSIACVHAPDIALQAMLRGLPMPRNARDRGAGMGNPQRVPIPSRDGAPPAGAGGSPRDWLREPEAARPCWP